MFESLLSRLTGSSADPLPEIEMRLALAALLVRIARADGHFDPAESARIDRVLARRYGLGESAALDLRREAEALEAQAPDTVRFTRAIKEAVPVADRADLVQAMWWVALADHDRDAEEDQVMRLVTSLLGLTDVDSALARQRAEAE